MNVMNRNFQTFGIVYFSNVDTVYRTNAHKRQIFQDNLQICNAFNPDILPQTEINKFSFFQV